MPNVTSDPVEERYDRQARISNWDQVKVQTSSVAVIGVGALGCELAKNLSLIGVGRLVLVDNDVVELSNLNRQMLFTDKDVGEWKASTAAKRLKEMNPFVKVESFDADVRTLSQELFESVDVVCSCLDSWGVRRWLNSLCVEIGKVMVDGAISGLYGNVQVVIPRKTSCLECYGQNLIPSEERMAECTLRRRRPSELVEDLLKVGIIIDLELAEQLFGLNIKTIYDLKYTKLELLGDKLPEDLRERILELRERLRPRVPAVQSVSATIAGMMTTEVIKLIHGGSLGPPLDGLLVYDAMYNRVSRVKLKRRDDCIVCGGERHEPLLLEIGPEATARDLKELIAARFAFPDAEVIFGSKILPDEARLSELSVTDGNIYYVYTSRRYEPLPIRLKIRDELNT